ncbi:hypothetical protein FZC03_06605 [Enterococcus faecium]|nr:hypothetical protein [Enterococcus faecium]
MKPIDFPEKYENLMRVAQQALANQQYQQAKELFQRAYELKESFEANSLLVFCLYELDEKKEALKQALLHEKQYLQNEEFAEFYFDLLISTQDFLYARKLIASTDFYEAFEQRVIEKIQFAEELSGQMERQKIKALHNKSEELPSLEPARQLASIDEIEQLPYHEFIQTASKLIVSPEVHILARAKLLETLRQLNECHPVFYLTIEEKLVKVIPKDLPKPQQQASYQQLCVFSDRYGNEDALLSSVLNEEFTLQSAIVYPVYDTYIEDPKRWFQLTVEACTGKTMDEGTEDEKQDFLKKREKILQQMIFFH